MASDNELKIKITADSSEVMAGMVQAKAAVDNAVTSMKDSFGGLGGALETLKGSWAMMAIGINQALEVMNKAIEIPKKLMAWGEMGAQLSRTEDSFRAVAAQAGYSANAIVESLQKASKGTLDSASIMQRAGRLMQEGIAPDKLTTLMSLLQKQAPIVGDTMKEAWDKVSESLSMGTTRALRHYVGIIDLNKEYEKYAATLGKTKDRLTEEAKETVMLDVVTRKLQETTKGINTELSEHAILMEKNKAIATDSLNSIYKSWVPIGEILSTIQARLLQVLALQMQLGGPFMDLSKGAGPSTTAEGLQKYPMPPMPAPAKSPIAEMSPSQQAEWDKKRLEIESQILKLQEDERGAIIKKYDAEIAGELDVDKKAELRKLKSAEIAAFDKKQKEEITAKTIESWGIASDAEEKMLNDVARLEGEQRIKSNEEGQKNTEQYIENWGKAIDAESEMMNKALAQDAEIKKKVQTEELEGQIKVNDQATEAAKKYYAQRFNLGQISATELARVETQLEGSRYSAELSLLDQLTSLYQSDREKYQQYLNQKKEAVEKNSKEIQTIETNLSEQNKKAWQGLLSPISSAISTSITGIIMGTTTLQKALANLFQSILLSFVNTLVKRMVDEWAVAELSKLNISEIYAALRTALFGEEAVTAVGEKKAEAAEIIPAEGAKAAMGAAAAMASIPYIGPALAAGAYGAMMELMGDALVVASAAGGWDVDRSALTMLHPQEMVLPANLANVVRNAASGGQGGGGFKPNNAMFKKIGEAIGDAHGRSISSAISRTARRLGVK